MTTQADDPGFHGADDPPGGRNAATEDRSCVSGTRPEVALDQLISSLRVRCGHGPGRIAVTVLAEQLGIKPRKLRAIMDREQKPDFELGIALMAALGSTVVNTVLEPYGYEGAHQVDEQLPEALEAVLEAGEDASRFSAEAIAAARDRHIDHQEEQKLIQRGTKARDSIDRSLTRLHGRRRAR